MTPDQKAVVKKRAIVDLQSLVTLYKVLFDSASAGLECAIADDWVGVADHLQTILLLSHEAATEGATPAVRKVGNEEMN